ncbi:MAG: diguanylate cyclase [Planctomycetes bacterium]|nr:diguanylate cyclase [Planctomycetota bacterium]
MASGVPERNERLRLAGTGPARGAHESNFASKYASRVVLVGRTGLDEAARSAPGAEVLRAPTLLDGVAEAAVLLGPDSPQACVVLVADDAIEEGERLAGTGAVREFVASVKRAVPRAKVYRVGSVMDGAFDGNVPSRGDTALIERLMAEAVGAIAAVSTPPPVPTVAKAAGTASPETAARDDREIEDLMAVMLDDVPAASAVNSAARGAETTAATAVWTDETLVQRMSKGHGVWGEVERLLRVRSGDEGLRLARASDVTQDGRIIDVVSAGRVLARMILTDAHALVLERARGLASWAAHWLMLDEQLKALREAAFKDPLTGAWNRRYFEKFLPAAIERAKEAKRFVTVLLFDIDDFKGWNDRYGHTAGDDVLRETVKLMESAVRPTDRVCRIGGDEFAVIFHEPEGPREVGSKHPEDVTSIASRFSALIRAKRFPKLGDDAPGRLGVSGGLATYPWDGRDMHELLKVADERALTCKRNGKNAIVFGDGAGDSR